MNQSELIEKVAQATELNQAAAGHAVKAVVNAILDALLAGDAVRVYGLGIFNVAARPAREGRNPQTGETIQIAASKVVRFHQARPSKMPSIRRLRRRLPGRSLHHQRNPRCESKRPLDVREGRDVDDLVGAADLVIIDATPHAEAYVRITARAARLVAVPVQPSPLRSVGHRQVRSGLPAGGSRIRTLGPPRH